mmetsp:Transcript_26301/g.83525  ORF Transcript_26301/g.83525 Transcript_26301/m.83525 type:complete len:217 (-) Transcript_26301:577-1227(-)
MASLACCARFCTPFARAAGTSPWPRSCATRTPRPVRRHSCWRPPTGSFAWSARCWRRARRSAKHRATTPRRSSGLRASISRPQCACCSTPAPCSTVGSAPTCSAAGRPACSRPSRSSCKRVRPRRRGRRRAPRPSRATARRRPSPRPSRRPSPRPSRRPSPRPSLRPRAGRASSRSGQLRKAPLREASRAGRWKGPAAMPSWARTGTSLLRTRSWA